MQGPRFVELVSTLIVHAYRIPADTAFSCLSFDNQAAESAQDDSYNFTLN